MLNTIKGMLIEYALALPPLVLVFDFNPQSLTRSRTITLRTGSAPGTRGGYDFALPTETARVAQGVTVQPESFTMDILLDATDRMNDGDPIATVAGIEPELDTLRTMVEPKAQGPGGLQTLASLGLGGQRAFQRSESASVLLLVWGTHILPVFLTSVRITEEAHLPSLVPYRARASLTMQVIEGNNPFYQVEKVRQVVGAALNTGRTVIGGIF
ncbi:hypothetical protein KI811_14780 [Geobacter hydrogenophilus]|uniref:Uncharacterized protein n=1 Tax=Geobacter hydrogenophilus TaxID=40983 RepID=A0A9W6LBW8_9BACT|nr:hypothetical protein [Geobacter hydrogenophilus]MBT0895076.1 hypothetical protein [Geobacter hydrogenophilus]GLI36901.1 hypothetical protein GHYDROH2_04020 [Geobacter hydrogenophilus]